MGNSAGLGTGRRRSRVRRLAWKCAMQGRRADAQIVKNALELHAISSRPMTQLARSAPVIPNIASTTAPCAFSLKISRTIRPTKIPATTDHVAPVTSTPSSHSEGVPLSREPRSRCRHPISSSMTMSLGLSSQKWQKYQYPGESFSHRESADHPHPYQLGFQYVFTCRRFAEG